MVTVRFSPTNVAVISKTPTVTVPYDAAIPITVATNRKVTALNTSRINVTQVLPTPPSDNPLVISLPSASDIKQGQPIYITDTGQVALVDADIVCIGIASANGAQGAQVPYVSNGSVVKSDWSDVVGTQSLQRGKNYFVGLNGTLTAIPPVSGLSQMVGIAASSYMLDVEIRPAVLLA